MIDRERLLQAVKVLEATLSQSFELGNDRFMDNRNEAIRLRRVISEKIAAMGRVADMALSGRSFIGCRSGSLVERSRQSSVDDLVEADLRARL